MPVARVLPYGRGPQFVPLSARQVGGRQVDHEAEATVPPGEAVTQPPEQSEQQDNAGHGQRQVQQSASQDGRDQLRSEPGGQGSQARVHRTTEGYRPHPLPAGPPTTRVDTHIPPYRVHPHARPQHGRKTGGDAASQRLHRTRSHSRLTGFLAAAATGAGRGSPAVATTYPCRGPRPWRPSSSISASEAEECFSSRSIVSR